MLVLHTIQRLKPLFLLSLMSFSVQTNIFYCTYAILVMVKKAGATGSFCVGLSVMQALGNLLFALQKQR